jgi:hypothetical protein
MTGDSPHLERGRTDKAAAITGAGARPESRDFFALLTYRREHFSLAILGVVAG